MLQMFNIFVPLLVGALLYSAFAPETYVARLIGIMPHMQTDVPFIRSWLCDMLWAYSFMGALCLTAFEQDFNKRKIHALLFMCIIFETAFELLQYFNIVRGTFDIIDILLEIPSNLLAIAIWKYIFKKTGGN